MSDLNNVSFTGRLTRDCESKVLPNGTHLVTADFANNTGWGDYKKTMFITANVWGTLGDKLSSHLTKGKQIAVTGKLEVQKWVSKADGQEKQKLVVNVNDLILMGKPAEGSAQEEPVDYGSQEDIAF